MVIFILAKKVFLREKIEKCFSDKILKIWRKKEGERERENVLYRIYEERPNTCGCVRVRERERERKRK